MADAPNNDKSWWTTLPGILTAIAAIITAVGGLIAILSQTGQISRPGAAVPTASAAPAGGGPSEPPVQTKAAAPAQAVNPTMSAKGVVVTHRDGTVVVLELGAIVGGPDSLALTNGQNVRHDLLKNIEFDAQKPWNGAATLVLLDGETMKAQLLGAQWVTGRNKLGPFETGFGNILRVEFRR